MRSYELLPDMQRHCTHMVRTCFSPCRTRASQRRSALSAPPKATTCWSSGAAAMQYSALLPDSVSTHAVVSVSHLFTCTPQECDLDAIHLAALICESQLKIIADNAKNRSDDLSDFSADWAVGTAVATKGITVPVPVRPELHKRAACFGTATLATRAASSA